MERRDIAREEDRATGPGILNKRRGQKIRKPLKNPLAPSGKSPA
jgi:hypothetical protein